MRALYLMLCCAFISLAGFSQQVKLMLPVGHTRVTSAHFSPNGKYVGVESFESTMKIWDVHSGKVLRVVGQNEGIILSSQFSPDGQTILTTSSDNTADLWDIATGELMLNVTGHAADVEAAKFSPDGKYIITASRDSTAKIWETRTGKLIHDLRGHDGFVTSASFSPDGKYVLTGPGKTKVWEAATGKLVYELGDDLLPGRFSADSKYIIAASRDSTIKIWETTTGNHVRNLTHGGVEFESADFTPDGKYIVTTTSWIPGFTSIWETSSGRMLWRQPEYSTEPVWFAKFSPDGQYVIAPTDQYSVRMWEVASGNVVMDLVGHSATVCAAEFSRDGKYILTVSGRHSTGIQGDGTVKIWDAKTGNLIHSLSNDIEVVRSATFSENGKSITAIYDDRISSWEMETGKIVNTTWQADGILCGYSKDMRYAATKRWAAMVWEISTGELIQELNAPFQSGPVDAVTFSADGNYIVTTFDSTGIIWDVATGKRVSTLAGHARGVRGGAFSADGKYIVTHAMDSSVKVWETVTGRLVTDIPVRTTWIKSAKFSPDGKYVIVSSDNTAKIWEVWTGKPVRHLTGHNFAVESAEFSPDGKHVVTASRDKTAKIWEVTTGMLVGELIGHGDWVISAEFSQDGRLVVTTSSDLSIKLWDVKTSTELLSWYAIDSVDWVVTHPSGLFDASPGAMDKLYFVQDLDVINLSQLKERYYEPGLWKKTMRGEELRDVTGMNSIDLPPDVHVGQVDEKGFMTIELTDRGGGIGEVAICINGKEVTKDARDNEAGHLAQTMKIQYFVGTHKNLRNGKNTISVTAWNKDHWVVSRGAAVSYDRREVEAHQPAVHIITCGISDYAGQRDIDLIYAAKDADDVSRALRLGAEKLFGLQRTYVYNLSTSQPRETWPTKANLTKTFKRIASTAKSIDIIIVYLSGHGINVGGAEGDWHYLTQDAYTLNAPAYNDPYIRQQTTLSSAELIELFNSVPAAKQVLIIDACASGKVVDNLLMKRDVPSSTLRALDRMKDRTGMHIITGCAADAVSYEATRYGQGVLTYSLLEGMRGASLREDEFVDVNKLFQYAQERVPTLAVGVGGIQTPMIFSPRGSQSFDIGQFSEAEKKAIPISKIRPVYIQSNFQDQDEMTDVLGLGKSVDQLLSESAAKGPDAPLIFVPVREYPDGCQLVGRYKRENGKIFLRFRNRCENEAVTVDITAEDSEDIARKVIKVIGD